MFPPHTPCLCFPPHPPSCPLQGKHVATVQLYIGTLKENMYVSVRRHLIFKQTKQPPLLQLSSAMTASGGAGGRAAQRRPDTAERDRLFWDR